MLETEIIPPNYDHSLYNNHLDTIRQTILQMRECNHIIVMGDYKLSSVFSLSLTDTEVITPLPSSSTMLEWTEDVVRHLSDLNLFQINILLKERYS